MPDIGNEKEREIAPIDEENTDNEKTRRIDISEHVDGAPAAEEAAAPVAAEAETEKTEEKTKEEITEQSEPAEAGEEYSAAEGTDAQLLSEFAPKPINIPNIDLEKEKKKQEKRKKNRGKEVKKVQARKNKRGKKKTAGQKAVVAIAGFVLFVLMTAALAGFISVLSVQTATSEYAFRLAVRNMDVPEITIGGIQNTEVLGLERSPSNAALIDIIRDNSDVLVTYREINSAIRGSGVERFIADRLKAASDYLLRGKSYNDLTGDEIAAVIRENSTLVQNLTGRVLTAEDYEVISEYFETYGDLGAVSRRALDETRLSRYTDISRHLTSLVILGAMLLICLVLLILICVICRESTYLPLGWSFILSGVMVILAAIFFRPSHTVSTQFLQIVLDSYFSFFTAAVIIIAGIFTVIGAFIFLIGNASADHDD
ncbi:MAG: hypothetical protein J1F63_06935 [Oscillospiraceae bacterium]|nr:hypothetical protein [Oscillospiraceae bacterium]